MIDDVLMPERDAENALADQGGDLVLDPLRRPRVAEAGGEAGDQVARRPEYPPQYVRLDRRPSCWKAWLEVET